MTQSNRPDIQGIWSADLQYSPGAGRDEMFVFPEGGNGFYEPHNWGVGGYE